MSNNILSSYPYYLRDVEEIKKIADIENVYINTLQSHKNYMLSEITVQTFHSQGLIKWEKIMGGFDSVYEHCSYVNHVKKKISQEKMVTVKSIGEYLLWRYGEGKYNIAYDAENFILNVQVNAASVDAKGLYERLREYVPCNIEVYVEIIET